MFQMSQVSKIVFVIVLAFVVIFLALSASLNKQMSETGNRQQGEERKRICHCLNAGAGGGGGGEL